MASLSCKSLLHSSLTFFSSILELAILESSSSISFWSFCSCPCRNTMSRSFWFKSPFKSSFSFVFVAQEAWRFSISSKNLSAFWFSVWLVLFSFSLSSSRLCLIDMTESNSSLAVSTDLFSRCLSILSSSITCFNVWTSSSSSVFSIVLLFKFRSVSSRKLRKPNISFSCFAVFSAIPFKSDCKASVLFSRTFFCSWVE